MWKDTELAYLAGIVDGEGSISVYCYQNYRGIGHHRYSEVFGVVTTDECLTNWIHAHFGGVVYHRPPSKQNPKWKDKYEWRASQSEIAVLVPAILPYLVIKEPQAKLLIEFRSTLAAPGKTGRSRSISPETMEKRAAICSALKSLHRG